MAESESQIAELFVEYDQSYLRDEQDRQLLESARASWAAFLEGSVLLGNPGRAPDAEAAAAAALGNGVRSFVELEAALGVAA